MYKCYSIWGMYNIDFPKHFLIIDSSSIHYFLPIFFEVNLTQLGNSVCLLKRYCVMAHRNMGIELWTLRFSSIKSDTEEENAVSRRSKSPPGFNCKFNNKKILQYYHLPNIIYFDHSSFFIDVDTINYMLVKNRMINSTRTFIVCGTSWI